MRRADRGPVAMLMACSALLGAAVYFSAPARADANDSVVYAYTATFGGIVCSTLDQYPTFDGILGIGQAMTEDGLTGFQAGQVIATSAIEICPRHIALVRSFADSHSGATA